MSDERNTPRDVGFRQAGIGLYIAFSCFRCGLKRNPLGRRRKLVGGRPQWYCAECVKGSKS